MEAQVKAGDPVKWRSKRRSRVLEAGTRQGKVVGFPKEGKIEVEYVMLMGYATEKKQRFASSWSQGKSRRVVIDIDQLVLDEERTSGS